MNVDAVLKALREICPGHDLQTHTAPVDEQFCVLPPSCIHQAVELLVERLGVRHLSTITGHDLDDQIALLYHFWDGGGLTLRTDLPHTEARLPTVTDLIPGAAFYEREVSEMLHVTFEGLDSPGPMFLPDDWNGEAPLRREPAAPPPEEDAE